jgi:hypothetical protein
MDGEHASREELLAVIAQLQVTVATLETRVHGL